MIDLSRFSSKPRTKLMEYMNIIIGLLAFVGTFIDAFTRKIKEGLHQAIQSSIVGTINVEGGIYTFTKRDSSSRPMIMVIVIVVIVIVMIMVIVIIVSFFLGSLCLIVIIMIIVIVFIVIFFLGSPFLIVIMIAFIHHGHSFTISVSQKLTGAKITNHA